LQERDGALRSPSASGTPLRTSRRIA
jgi:hypothetical protein